MAMRIFNRRNNQKEATMKRTILAMTAVALLGPNLVVAADLIPGTTLSIGFESAQVQGAGRNINVYRVPVTDVNTRVTTFYDVQFQFGILSDGSIGFTRMSSAAVSSSQIKAADNFIAGTYKDSNGVLLQVEGPVVLSGGRLQYSIRSITSGKKFDATWITGPVAGHPQVGGFNPTPTEGSAGAFGVMGGADFSISGQEFGCNGHAVGVSQLGSTLVISSYFFGFGFACSRTRGAEASVTLSKN